jgi:hypothetical protein
MKTHRAVLALLALLLLCAPRVLAAQPDQARLQAFVASVARLWERGDADALVDLAPGDGRIVLDLGSDEAGAVEKRHAAAALRELFGGRDPVSVRATQVTVAGGEPVRGFGELAWVSRVRGVTDSQTSTVYVGAVWERGAWRIRELRILR